MGSHGGGTAEGQRKILEGYGVTEAAMGVEIRSSMETVLLGVTPEGFRVFVDRNAWESDGVVVVNRIKPHTDFSGKIESGLLKMMMIGMGKLVGATEGHRYSWKYGFETTIRAVSGKVLASGKILCGVAVVENELHQIAVVRAALPEGIVAQEESALQLARTLVPRIPFEKLQLLIVDEMGKNISGTGMDTKVIGRGVELPPGEAPSISMIYVRELTLESGGNAVGVGFADLIHERLYQKIDFEKMYLNARTALSTAGGRLPIHLPSDREALDFAFGHLGSPEPAEQRVVWIRNTLSLDRIAISTPLAGEAAALKSWRLLEGDRPAGFEPAGNLNSLF
jgi:acyl-CoA synthetase (AMP-forming)/AMP-acid ligase II